MNHTITIEEAEQYLNLFKTHENKYIIGIHQPGITLYKQQLRALNIFYCLHVTQRINKNTTIGIIGGGVGGCTFAAACLKSKINTYVFETYPEYLPIQSRCRGREIHPHIYDWPLDESTTVNAELPILNWSKCATDKFCQDIIRQFDEIKEDFDGDGLSYKTYLHEYFNCEKIKKINFDVSDKKYLLKAKIKGDPKPFDFTCDIIILAIGYGLEANIFGQSTPLYWRDLDTHQINTNNKKYFISGTGDGALMDLFVIMIKGFNYDLLLNAINFSTSAHFIVAQLKQAREEFFSRPQPLSFMHDIYESLYSEHLSSLIDNLNFTSTEVTLNGQEKFSNSLNLDKISMLNGLFVYLLLKKKKFRFVPGNLSYDKDTELYKINGHHKAYSEKTHVIFLRHGTDKAAVINNIPRLESELTKRDLIVKQKGSLKDGLVKKMWSDEALNQIFARAHYDRIESVSANALPILECYTNIITEALKRFFKRGFKFRIAIHKVVLNLGKLGFVQITPYSGTRTFKFKGSFGKLHSAIGNVGYSIQTGKPSLITYSDGDKDNEFNTYLTTVLGIKNASLKFNERKAYFTLPIMAPVKGFSAESEIETTFMMPNLVLYIDSNNEKLFRNEIFFEIVLSATQGFVQAFESSFEKSQFNMDDVDFKFKLQMDVGLNKSVYDSEFFRKDDEHFNSFCVLLKSLNDQHMVNFKAFHSFKFVKK